MVWPVAPTRYHCRVVDWPERSYSSIGFTYTWLLSSSWSDDPPTYCFWLKIGTKVLPCFQGIRQQSIGSSRLLLYSHGGPPCSVLVSLQVFPSSFFWEEPFFGGESYPHTPLCSQDGAQKVPEKKVCEDRAIPNYLRRDTSKTMIRLIHRLHRVLSGLGPLPSPSPSDPFAKLGTYETHGTRRRFMRWLFKCHFNGSLSIGVYGTFTCGGVTTCCRLRC